MSRPTLWSINSPLRVHCRNQRGQTHGTTAGYKDPPVPRRLVGPGQLTLPPSHQSPSGLVSKIGLDSKYGKVRTRTQTGVRFCGLPVRSHRGKGQTHLRQVANFDSQNHRATIRSDLSGPETDVPYWSVNSYRKTGPPRPSTHVTHSVASQEKLEGSRIYGKSYIPIPKSLHPHLKWWLEESNVLRSQPLHTLKHALQLFTDASKEGWGAHLNEHTARGDWSLPESKLHINFLELKAVFLALRRFQNLCQNNVVLIATDNGGLCKQGRRHEIRTSVCPSLEDYDLVYQKSGHPQSSPHPRSPECGSRQAFQVGPNHSNRMVSPPTNFSDNLQQVAPTPDRSVCNKIQQQTIPVCITSAGYSGLGNRCAQHVLGKSGSICLPTDGHLGQSGGKAAKQSMQEAHTDCPRVAKHALVLGSSVHVQSNSTEPTQPAQSADTAIQSDSPQELDQPKSLCKAPRASAIKEQGFSQAMAARIEATQRRSTRSVYEAKWSIFTKWCISHKVDFRAPPVKSVADFLMYLFQDRKLQPSTIDGYRSAIADKLGNSSINTSNSKISLASWIVSTEIDPRVG